MRSSFFCFSGKEYAKKENLKEMGDVTSGMASTVIQVYLKAILNSYIHPKLMARQATLQVIKLILQQGLVHPVQIVPYLVCMATDPDTRVSNAADRELQVKDGDFNMLLATLSTRIMSNKGFESISVLKI